MKNPSILALTLILMGLCYPERALRDFDFAYFPSTKPPNGIGVRVRFGRFWLLTLKMALHKQY